MCPARPPARASTSSAAASTRSHGPRSTAGSRLPCTARSSPTTSQPQSSGSRQSSPITSPPARASARSSSSVAPVPKWIVGASTAARIRAGVRRDELVVVRGRERPDPRVEELDHVGARLDLRGDVARELLREPVEQRMPGRGVAVHQRLRPREVARRLALDEIARDRERRAAEADERLLGRRARGGRGESASRIAPVGLGHAEPVDVRAPTRSGARPPGRRPRRARRRCPSRARAT